MHSVHDAMAVPTSGRSRRWLRNVATSYGDILVGGAIYVAFTPFLVHHLGLEAFAVWVVSHTITFYLSLLDLGFGQAHVRFHARHAARGQREAVHRLAGTIAPALALAGLVAAVLAGLIAVAPLERWFQVSTVLEADLRLVVVILGLNLLISLPGSTLENVYEGEQRFDIRNLRSIVLRLITVAVQVALLLNGYGIVALAAVELGVSVLRVGIDLVLANRLVPGLLRTRVAMDPRVWRRIRPFALWAFVDDLLVEGSAHLDKLLVAVFLPMALLTPYALCAALAGLIFLAVRPVTETFFPMAAGLHARGKRLELSQLLLSGTKAVLGLTTPIAIMLVFFGETVLLTWVPDVGESLTPGLLQLVVLTFYFSAAWWTATLVLMAVNRIRLVAVMTLVELALALALIVLLVPSYGLIGFATAALVANVIVAFGVLMPAVCGSTGLPPRAFLAATFGRMILVSLPAMLLAAGFHVVVEESGWPTLIAAAAVVALVYALSVFWGGLDAWERNQAVALLKKLSASFELRLSEVKRP